VTRRPGSTIPAGLAALLFLGLVVAGCGSGGTTSPATPSTSAAEPIAANTVVINNFSFSPADLTVAPGTKVTVKNEDSTTHTLTATGAKAFDTGNIASGASAPFTAPTQPGSYAYTCTIHPFMKGTLKVS
jgi:plastocyanin